MGLLEKASNFASDSDIAVAPAVDEVPTASSTGAGGIAGAVQGLRARADSFRSRAAAPPASPAAPIKAEARPVAESAAAPPAGVAIRGLLQRAESMRESDARSEIPPLPERAASGLLARARRFREGAAATTSPPASVAATPSPAGAIAEAAPDSSADSLSVEAPLELAATPEVSESIDRGSDIDIADSADTPATDFVPTPASPDEAHSALDQSDSETDLFEVEELAPTADEAESTESLEPDAAGVDSSAAGLDRPGAQESFPEADTGPAFLQEEEELVFAGPASAADDSLDSDSDFGPDASVAEHSQAESTPVSESSAPGPVTKSEGETQTEAEDVAPHAGEASEQVAFEDPLFDDLIPESYEPVVPPDSRADTDSGASGQANAASESSQTELSEQAPAGDGETSAAADSGAEPLPDFDPGPVPVDEELRDFDEFLEREILTEEAIEEPPAAPESAADAGEARGLRERAEAAEASRAAEVAGESEAPAMFADEDYDAYMDPDSDLGDAGDLPSWPYDPPGPDADPARESAARTPGEDEDPFGLWEMDAEKEAEQQARQLELKGDAEPGQSEDGMLFEVDEGFTTAPVEAHIASQKKIDHYLSLFDITKEISNISEFDELWENILYAIMGQVGAETICILSSTSRVSSGAIFYPVSHSGFELPEGWALGRGDEIYDQMAASTGVRYAEEFLNSLQNPVSPLERRILENTRAKLVVPLKNMNQMFGIVILGGQVSGDDYTIDDIEFLTLLGEIAAVGVDRVLSRIEFERDTEELRRRNMVHGSMFSLARRASGVKSLDDIYDILTRHLREDFYAESFSVVLLSPRERRYRIFAGNEISPESIEKFSLDVNSELIATISNLVRVYDLKDFRENRELAGCYTNDDLGLMRHYWIVPLINMNWLVGFITIHRTNIPWTEFHRELMVTAAEIVSSVFANCIIMNERESLFRDPFSPLEERLKEEVKKSAQFQAPVSLVDVRVKNIRRILEINPGEEVTGFLMALNRSIASSLFETDFMARVGQGRFALILPGRGRVEAEIFVKKLKADFNRMRLLPGSPIDVQYSHQIISAPDDAAEAGKMLSIFE
ncbi:MAG: hypothetical protein NXI24_18630 [bacterium]|nr:hypothetical protein [bacterium]